MLSISTSFLTLVLTTGKLYFYQQDGTLDTIDPHWKMTSLVLPFIVTLLAGPVFTVIIVSAYFKGFVLVMIAFVMVSNRIVLKLPCLNRQVFKASELGVSPRKLLKRQQKRLFIAVATSWLAPCTSKYGSCGA